jgi:midasin
LTEALTTANAPVFDEVLSCLQAFVALPAQIEKAQFEWVDGLLVSALQRGDWLVLDNANLCSPSVLDRLNSLLEPNGYLSINEHPTENGEPRIVWPHLDFRIFLTMDPRHGELSRAMRNRSIELFIMHEPVVDHDQTTPTHALEASMSRYRNLLSVDQDQIMDYATDHLSFEDVSVHQRFISQIQQGLIKEPKLQKSASGALNLFSRLDSDWVAQSMTSNTTSLVALQSGANQVSPLALCFPRYVC